MQNSSEPTKNADRFLLGSRRADLLAFALVLFLMLLSGYRLRVHYRHPLPTKTLKAVR